jgi:hypothetical protein
VIREYGHLQDSAQHPPKLVQVLHIGHCPDSSREYTSGCSTLGANPDMGHLSSLLISWNQPLLHLRWHDITDSVEGLEERILELRQSCVQVNFSLLMSKFCEVTGSSQKCCWTRGKEVHMESIQGAKKITTEGGKSILSVRSPHVCEVMLSRSEKLDVEVNFQTLCTGDNGLITLVDVLGQLRVCFHKEQLTSLLRDINQILSMLREFWWTGLHEILVAWLQSLKKRAEHSL